jgi:heme-degrading monooxygenase HmoA
MTSPQLILLVRFKSSLPFEELEEIMKRRAHEFRALPGLRQKYYMQDPESGELAGLYLWDSQEALAEYQASELKATIAEAYSAVSKPRVEVYRVLMPLREEA